MLALCNQAQTGQVSIIELKAVVKNDNLMLQLFGTPDQDSALAELQSVVLDRKEEYKAFVQQQTLLKYLIRYLDPKIAGIYCIFALLGTYRLYTHTVLLA